MKVEPSGRYSEVVVFNETTQRVQDEPEHDERTVSDGERAQEEPGDWEDVPLTTEDYEWHGVTDQPKQAEET